MENYAELMFRGAVADLQKARGTFDKYQTAYRHRTAEALGPDEIQFVTQAASFYVASLTSDGWPYIQHRGGPRGFVQVIGPSRLACADYRGNRQYITQGNLAADGRVSLFFMDYLRHARLKLQARAALVDLADADAALAERFAGSEPAAERILTLDIVAMDWNCPKYIPTLYPEDALRQIVGPQIGKLQAENEALKAELAALRAQTSA